MDLLKVIHKGYEEKDKMWTIGDKKLWPINQPLYLYFDSLC